MICSVLTYISVLRSNTYTWLINSVFLINVEIAKKKKLHTKGNSVRTFGLLRQKTQKITNLFKRSILLEEGHAPLHQKLPNVAKIDDNDANRYRW